jgi:glycerol-3-phosphate dehydrogenase
MFEGIFDLAVIGGGINGAAIARDAALRGMRVILLEKRDFGSGVSTKTSKLAHGGLRYLEHYEFRLVKEALEERAFLLTHASHLVCPLPIILPVYTHDPHPIWKIRLGLSLYDFLGRNGLLPKHWKLTKDELVAIFPGLKQEGLIAGFCYFDAQMNDTRLLIENILSAEEAGAVVLNYAPVKQLSIQEGRVDGLYFQLPGSTDIQRIDAAHVVNATGAWCDQVSHMEQGVLSSLVTPTKGCHLVLRQCIDQALFLRAPQDGRVFFIIPFERIEEIGKEPLCLVGTTDTLFEGDPDTLLVDEIDQDYLLKAVNHYFPHLNLTKQAIVATFTGLRPLISKGEISQAKRPSSLSRSSLIHTSAAGVFSVVGGKYTSFRKLAEEVVDQVVAKHGQPQLFLPCMTSDLAFPGTPTHLTKIKLDEVGLEAKMIEHLIANYGNRSLHIADLIKQDASLRAPLCSIHPHLQAELHYAIQREHVKTAEDWLFRRTYIGYTSCKGEKCANITRQIFAHYFGKEP